MCSHPTLNDDDTNNQRNISSSNFRLWIYGLWHKRFVRFKRTSAAQLACTSTYVKGSDSGSKNIDSVSNCPRSNGKETWHKAFKVHKMNVCIGRICLNIIIVMEDKTFFFCFFSAMIDHKSLSKYLNSMDLGMEDRNLRIIFFTSSLVKSNIERYMGHI